MFASAHSMMTRGFQGFIPVGKLHVFRKLYFVLTRYAVTMGCEIWRCTRNHNSHHRFGSREEIFQGRSRNSAVFVLRFLFGTTTSFAMVQLRGTLFVRHSFSGCCCTSCHPSSHRLIPSQSPRRPNPSTCVRFVRLFPVRSRKRRV